MSINPLNLTRNFKLYYSAFSPVFIEIPIKNNATETTWVSDGITMSYLKDRINEIGADYFGELTTTTTTTTTTSATSLNKIENNCYSYPSTNLLIGFIIGISLIILLSSINLVVMISEKRSKSRTKMEKNSGESLRFHEMFPDLNHPRQQRQQQQK
ncbi:unnamed protein product [Rotaria sordida]|uniref:Uncharacterized protein n=1 Tax=Rotaria sordida TaxID=392033 RepID=A0A815TD89_9BILA|nr:unnamed protein product [Rotaria sordida]